MGLVIHLNVNPHDIEPKKWEDTYQESLQLLQNWPVPLMRFKISERHEEQCDEELYVYTDAIVQDEDSPTEHWKICGDLVSYRHAEFFRIYRHLDQQIKSRVEWDGRDVLWASFDEWDEVEEYGINIFGDKTQGYPYHLAVLAVAILFESRFPHSIYLGGSIDRYQVEQMVEWVNAWASVPVTMPVCLEPERLYQRLDSLYDSPDLVIKRFKTVFCGSEEEQLSALLRIADKKAVIDDFIQELSDYQSLSQIGSVNLVSRFLTVTQDLRQLIDVVSSIRQSEGDQAKFTLEELLKALCNQFITIDAQEREPLLLFEYPRNQLMTIKEVFKQLFLTLGGMPDAIEFYIDSEQLLEMFSSYEPEKRALFQDIISEGQQTCRETLAQLGQLLEEVKKEARREEKDEDEEDHEAEVPSVSPAETYIMDQVNAQIDHFPNPEQIAEQMGKQLRSMIQEHPDIFSSHDKAYYLKFLCRVCSQTWLVLRETAWEAIEQIEDVAQLKSLFALSLVSSPSDEFSRFRIYLLEHKELWPYLAAQ